MSTAICPSCEAGRMEIFYELRDLPVHSVLLLPTRDEALNYPRGDLSLGFCRACGFISNTRFDPSKHDYSANYEETQGYSPTFNAFAKRLAQHLIDRYDLHDRNIIEIGCGKGEFITLLCEMGGNIGIGIDPSYIKERSLAGESERVTFIKDFYSEKYAHLKADFICCKMTLEHIHNTAEFLRTVRRAVEGQEETTIFFQIPDVTRILSDIGFWDIYYEHCSYFSPGSLARAFRHVGFDVLDLWRDFDDQYLMIEARPRSGTGKTFPQLEDDLDALAGGVAHFTAAYPQVLSRWRHYLDELHRHGMRAVLWGSGSKGVAFLTTLQIVEQIEYTVDINPHKHGMFMAGTGQQIVAPEFLREYKPDVVVIMNPIYKAEIERNLEQLGVRAEVRTV